MSTQFVIPSDSYNLDINYPVEGNIFNFKIYINKSSGRWYLDIRDEDKNEILAGLKIMPFQNLTKRYKSVNRSLFSGNVWSLPLNENGDAIYFGKLVPVIIDNFGTTDTVYGLFYLDEDESNSLDTILQSIVN